jgi:hypothetical protein
MPTPQLSATVGMDDAPTRSYGIEGAYKMKNRHAEYKTGTGTGVGIAIGAGVGMAVALLLGWNIALGIAVGVALGLVFGSALDINRSSQPK